MNTINDIAHRNVGIAALYTAAGIQLSYVRVCLNRSVTASQLG